MICETIRKGSECAFMTKKGCSYNGGVCYEIVEKCSGCSRSAQFSSGWYCTSFPEPSRKWNSGHCNMATHVSLATETASGKKINPLKASKRGKK